MQEKHYWSSKWQFILATTGAAVGLGNIWRFPYMIGTHGGSAFLMLYLLFIALIGFPILLGEILIGQQSRKNPVDALHALSNTQTIQQGKRWEWLGWWGALTLLFILAFYSVVSGWSIAYLLKSLSGNFTLTSSEQITGIWENFLSHPQNLLLWHTVFLLLTMCVVSLGIQKGLEKITRYLTPSLYLLLIFLAAYSTITHGFLQTAHFMFDFNWKAISMPVVISAMGHAFFTLALGAGAMLTYGAYIPKKISLIKSLGWVVCLDVSVALLAGFSIFPLVFDTLHTPTSASGPGLLFVTLPIYFSTAKIGKLLGCGFFSLLLFAAWTSSINLAEPLVFILTEKFSFSRRASSLLIGLLAWGLGVISALSFNIWKNVTFFQQKISLFDLMTTIPTDIMLPIGGIGFSLFSGWLLERKRIQHFFPKKTYRLWEFLTRYLAPLLIFLVLIQGVSAFL